MKVREIILELREILDRTNYGCWYNPETTEVEYVRVHGHDQWMEEYLLKSEGLVGGQDYETVFDEGIERGWVRIVFSEQGAVINIQGRSEAIRKGARTLLATCMQPDVDPVYLSILEGSLWDADPDDDTRYLMPRDRSAMAAAIRGYE